MLDAARPANIDPVRSSAIDGSFVIAYALGTVGDIAIEVEEDWAAVTSVAVNRQIRASELGSEWIQETARAVDDTIHGRYRIERTHWRNRPIRTTVNTSDPTSRTTSWWHRLLIAERFLNHQRTQLDDDCRAAQPRPGASPTG